MSQDPSAIRRLINPMVLKLGGGVEADIRTDDDLRLFQSLLNQNPELREGLMQRIRRGEDPAQATAALVQEVRQAYGGGHNVARPKTMAEAIKEFANGATMLVDPRCPTALGDTYMPLKAQAEAADMTLQDVGETTCCHARSDKYWVTDPQGIAWAGFGRMFSDSFAGIAPSSAAGFVASELVGAGLAVAVHKFFAGAPVAPNTNSAVGETRNA
jgi:hypothetical protein